MSHLPFADAAVAASTFSNLVLYKIPVTLTGGVAIAYNTLLFSTENNMGQFVATQVWFHVDNNSGLDTRTFTASVGHNGPSTFDNICASDTYGSAGTTDLYLKNNKAVLMTGRIATSYYNTATPANATTGVYLRVTASPSATITGTIFVLGFYTGVRP